MSLTQTKQKLHSLMMNLKSTMNEINELFHSTDFNAELARLTNYLNDIDHIMFKEQANLVENSPELMTKLEQERRDYYLERRECKAILQAKVHIDNSGILVDNESINLLADKVDVCLDESSYIYRIRSNEGVKLLSEIKKQNGKFNHNLYTYSRSIVHDIGRENLKEQLGIDKIPPLLTSISQRISIKQKREQQNNTNEVDTQKVIAEVTTNKTVAKEKPQPKSLIDNLDMLLQTSTDSATLTTVQTNEYVHTVSETKEVDEVLKNSFLAEILESEYEEIKYTNSGLVVKPINKNPKNQGKNPSKTQVKRLIKSLGSILDVNLIKEAHSFTSQYGTVSVSVTNKNIEFIITR